MRKTTMRLAGAAVALALVGLALVVRGLWLGANGRPGLLRQGRDTYAWIRCFQIVVGGLVLVAIAAAWEWQQLWLLVLALGVLGEEMLETSRILTALKAGPDRHQAAPDSTGKPTNGAIQRFA